MLADAGISGREKSELMAIMGSGVLVSVFSIRSSPGMCERDRKVGLKAIEVRWFCMC